jgi:hypothetical protein
VSIVPNSINSIPIAPDLGLHRSKVTAVDASNPTTQASGVNARGFEKAILDIFLEPSGATTVTIEILFWSDKAAAFVSASPALTTGAVTVSSQFQFDVLGRTFFAKLTAGTFGTNGVTLHVSGSQRREDTA